MEGFNFGDYPSSCIVHPGVPQCQPIPNILKNDHSGIVQPGVPQCQPIPNILKNDHSGIVSQRRISRRGTIPKSLEEVPQEAKIPERKKTSLGFEELFKLLDQQGVPQKGTIPESLKELLTRTAKEYQWSPEKLAQIETGLRNQNWSAEQIDLVEKTIRDEKWTTKHIVELEKSFREKKNGDFIVLAQAHIPNSNYNKNNCAFSAAGISGRSGFVSSSSSGFHEGGIHGLRDDFSGFMSKASSKYVSVTIKVGCILM